MPIGLDVDFEDTERGPASPALEVPGGYLSNSRIAKYLRCGENFRRTYVEGNRWRGNASTSVGKSVHALVENTLRDFMATGYLRPIEAGLDEASGVTTGILNDTELVGDELAVSNDEYIARVQRAYKVWHELRAPEIVPVVVEKEFDQPVNGVRVKGIIDLIDAGSGTNTIIDLKITKRKKSEREAKNSLQLALYANVTSVPRVGFDAIVDKASGTEVHPVRVTLTPGEIKWAGTLVRNVAESISKGVFPLSSPEEWWCSESFCPFWKDCRGGAG